MPEGPQTIIIEDRDEAHGFERGWMTAQNDQFLSEGSKEPSVAGLDTLLIEN
jgi:hypothetical protein